MPGRPRKTGATNGFRATFGRRLQRETLARRPPEIHSIRSRHSKAAASSPASLPALTVPRRVRLGRPPRRTGRIDPLGARPLPERAPVDRHRDVPKNFPSAQFGARVRLVARVTGPRLRCLGGGLRSWLAVRCTRTPALYLTSPPSCGCCADNRGPGAMRGVTRSGLWSEIPETRAEPAASGRRSRA